MTVTIQAVAGSFAENKDVAREVRLTTIAPALERKEEVILDFFGVTGATQSFIHALISEPIREYGDAVFDFVLFKNCNPVVQEVVTIVAEYMQES